MAANNKRSRGKAHHERQRIVCLKHKQQRAAKRTKKLAFWIAKGVKKNGKKVLTMEQRQVRKADRKEARRIAQAAKRAEQQQNHEQYKSRRKFKGGNGKPRQRISEKEEE